MEDKNQSQSRKVAVFFLEEGVKERVVDIRGKGMQARKYIKNRKKMKRNERRVREREKKKV